MISLALIKSETWSTCMIQANHTKKIKVPVKTN